MQQQVNIMSKNILNILVVSASSLPLARKIRDKYQGKTIIYCREADNDVEPFTSFEELAGDLFNKSEAMVFIGADGHLRTEHRSVRQ